MADGRTYYVLCGDNCKFESMTKEQIIAAIAEATGNTVTDVDSAFITKIKEQNAGTAVKIWIGTQAEYNALVATSSISPDTLYCTSDGNKLSELQNEINALQNQVDEIIDGDIVCGRASGMRFGSDAIITAQNSAATGDIKGITLSTVMNKILYFPDYGKTIIVDDSDWGEGKVLDTKIIYADEFSGGNVPANYLPSAFMLQKNSQYNALFIYTINYCPFSFGEQSVAAFGSSYGFRDIRAAAMYGGATAIPEYVGVPVKIRYIVVGEYMPTA